MHRAQRDTVAGQRPERLAGQFTPTSVLLGRRRYCENFLQERLRLCDVRASNVLVAFPDGVLHADKECHVLSGRVAHLSLKVFLTAHSALLGLHW
jgi:hypothetical protein